jgi:GDP/UDP-N,N'-diacetylbacillosamine 2-epimerase (hydrolysing)
VSRRVLFVTGTRAEYGLLRPLMAEVARHPRMRLQILATGAHLSPEFGMTAREIAADGFSIDERVEILLSSDTDVGVCKAMGLGLISFGEAYARLGPDLVVGLGDRFELFAAVAAAVTMRRPVAHIHGGELTEGAFDDAFRHAITKMSMLHFTSTEVYRGRVIQLGEAPERVFNVGALGVDNIRTMPLLPREQLETELDFPLGERLALVTFHPVTLDLRSAEQQAGALLEALAARPDLRVVFTRANPDPEGRAINALIDAFVAGHPGRSRAFASLGALRYLSLMRWASAVVGNSSSGIIEAPSLGIPTVDIGDRQRGRVRAESVVDCRPTAEAIGAALDAVLDPAFRARARTVVNPYGDGHAAERICALLDEHADLPLKKGFYDLPAPSASPIAEATR